MRWKLSHIGTNEKNGQSALSTIAIVQEENVLKAVELLKRGESLEVLWTKSRPANDDNWQSFAAECGLPSQAGTKTDSAKMAVLGFDSVGMVFYRVAVPAVSKEEIAAMVKLQAEALLPLPAEQMELAWRTGRVQNGELTITIVAAKKEHLQKFVDRVRVFEPEKILLNCEGLMKAWRVLFAGENNTCVVVSIGTRNTQVCLAEDAKLTNAAVLDIGLEDLSVSDQLSPQTELNERFAQDIRSVLELFGYAEVAEVPVSVLSNGSSTIEDIVSYLISEGFKAKAALPDIEEKKITTKLSAEDIYEYRVPIGLGLCAYDGDTEQLNIFERLHKPARQQKKHWIYSPRVAAAIATVMLVVLVIVSYAVDVAKPKAIEKRLKTAALSTNLELLVERQRLLKAVALQRPDLLELLSQVSASGDRGILLDTFYFKKGQPVRISGQVQSADLLYDFQKRLLDKKDIEEVKIQSTSRDHKSKKIQFTITFHYKNFTRKGA